MRQEVATEPEGFGTIEVAGMSDEPIRDESGEEGKSAGTGQAADAEFVRKRLERMIPGQVDPGEVEALAGRPGFIESLDAAGLLEVSRILLEHGCVDKAIALFGELNIRFPDFVPGWKEHADVLAILGDRRGLVALRYRAIKALGADRAGQIVEVLPAEQGRDAAERDGGGLHALMAERQGHEGDAVSALVSGEDGLGQEFSPFLEARQRGDDLERYLSLFRGRKEVFARQWVNKNRGSSGYVPVERPFTSADLEDHLRGRYTYGIYLMSADNTVWTGVIDIDLKKGFRRPGALKGQASALKREIRFIMDTIDQAASRAGLSPIAEFSGGKGYHVWFPAAEPVPAHVMRRALAALIHGMSEKIEFFHLEIFPKQDRLSGKGLGNLVKLPLGIHRVTGKRSFFLAGASFGPDRQLEILRGLTAAPGARFMDLAKESVRTEVVVHPALAALKDSFPELHQLQQGCRIVCQLVTESLSGREIGERGRKVLLQTVGHLSQGRQMLHHILSKSPGYNRPLLDYEISRLRGTPLGCRRIHSLMGQGEGGIDCSFVLKKGEYAHPLLHVEGWSLGEGDLPVKAERIENLRDALMNLKSAIEVVERFI